MSTDEVLLVMLTAMNDETSRFELDDELAHCNAFVSSTRIVFEFLSNNATLVKVSDALYNCGLDNQVISFGVLYLSVDPHELAQTILH